MNILLVEDNPADVRLVREALGEGNVPANLDWAHLSEEAVAHRRYGVAAAKEFATDLVLLDLNLPGMNGHAILSIIKSDPELRHIPVVVLSSGLQARRAERLPFLRQCLRRQARRLRAVTAVDRIDRVLLARDGDVADARDVTWRATDPP